MEPITHEFESPIGPIHFCMDTHGRLQKLLFAEAAPFHRPAGRRSPVLPPRDVGVADDAAAGAADVSDRLGRYFAGELDALDDIVVAIHGSDFQHRVWAAVRRIPPGTVTSYGELAARLGYADGRMARGIGTANATNAVALIIPCHRVIGKDGGLRGYAWGLERKRWLLEHERSRHADRAVVAAHAAAATL